MDGRVAKIVGHEHHVQDAGKGEVTTGAVRDVEEGAADCGVWGRYDPPRLGISLFSFVLLFVSGQGRRSTRARGG